MMLRGTRIKLAQKWGISEFVIVIRFETRKKLIQAAIIVHEDDDADCTNEHRGGHMRVGLRVF